jgi:hypothetical protein
MSSRSHFSSPTHRGNSSLTKPHGEVKIGFLKVSIMTAGNCHQRLGPERRIRSPSLPSALFSDLWLIVSFWEASQTDLRLKSSYSAEMCELQAHAAEIKLHVQLFTRS